MMVPVTHDPDRRLAITVQRVVYNELETEVLEFVPLMTSCESLSSPSRPGATASTVMVK